MPTFLTILYFIPELYILFQWADGHIEKCDGNCILRQLQAISTRKRFSACRIRPSTIFPHSLPIFNINLYPSVQLSTLSFRLSGGFGMGYKVRWDVTRTMNMLQVGGVAIGPMTRRRRSLSLQRLKACGGTVMFTNAFEIGFALLVKNLFSQLLYLIN